MLKVINILVVFVFFLSGCGAGDNGKRESGTVKGRSAGYSWLTDDPRAVLERDHSALMNGLYSFNTKVMINSGSVYSDLLYGSHVVTRSIHISGGSTDYSIDYFMDSWANMDVDKANNVLSGLISKYGEPKYKSLSDHERRWLKSDQKTQRKTDEFEFTSDGLIVSGDIVEKVVSYSEENRFQVTVIYSLVD